MSRAGDRVELGERMAMWATPGKWFKRSTLWKLARRVGHACKEDDDLITSLLYGSGTDGGGDARAPDNSSPPTA